MYELGLFVTLKCSILWNTMNLQIYQLYVRLEKYRNHVCCVVDTVKVYLRNFENGSIILTVHNSEIPQYGTE